MTYCVDYFELPSCVPISCADPDAIETEMCPDPENICDPSSVSH